MIIKDTLYIIRIYDHSKTLKLILNHWERLTIYQRINNAWNCIIRCVLSYENPYVDQIRQVQKDWYILIDRFDPLTQQSSVVYEGLHSTLTDQLTTNGELIFTFYSVGYTDLLKRRVVVPPTGFEYSSKEGAAESVVKGFVNDQMVVPEDADRVVDGFTVDIDGGEGNSVSKNSRYTNLFTVIDEMSEKGNINFGVVGSDPPGSFTFKAKTFWGLDKRRTNTDGNKPVIFSVLNGNMDIPILSLNYSEEKNFIYVGGQGVGLDRVILTVSDADSILGSPFGRKEAFIEAKEESENTSLETAGLAYLIKNKANKELTFNVLQNTNSLWIRDWELGDYITSEYGPYSFDKQIVEVQINVTAGLSAQSIENISVEMKDLYYG